MAQMMPLGLKTPLEETVDQGSVQAATEMNQRIVRAHYEVFVAAKPSLKELYSYDECWEDYRLGCIYSAQCVYMTKATISA